MKNKTFIIFDLMIQILLVIITIWISIKEGEFLEYDAFAWFIGLGFWQLGSGLIKHNHYEIGMKPYLIMVRNFGIACFSIFVLAFILNQLETTIFSIVLILLFIILIWSFLLAILYFYLTICQLLNKEDISF